MKTPVYQQLNVLLRDLLRKGEFKPGDRFLTERQVSERFGVSRATANKALSNLVSEGLLEFRAGVGTFVRGMALQYDADSLASFTETAAAAGLAPATQVREFTQLSGAAAPAEVAASLRLRPEQEVCFVERVRLADWKPVILERRYIVSDFCPGLTASDLTGSVYGLWTERYGLELGSAEEIVHAVVLRGPEAKLLKVRSGSVAGFRVTSTGYLADGAPLWWEQSWYRGDQYELHNRLGPLHPTPRIAGAPDPGADKP
jgi:GntR family transcriptional regulator